MPILLHTADWQLGMKAAHAGPAAAAVRDARMAAARAVVAAARDHGAVAILVTGDTFEDNGVDRALVRRAADILGDAAPIPVFIIPGNHDPLVPGSVWEHPAWAEHPNITVIRHARPMPLPVLGFTLYPCPLSAKHSPDDPTAWIAAAPAAPADAPLRVGLAHGTVTGGALDGDLDYPIARDTAERLGLDYLALGHWHSTATFPARPGAPERLAYSGTHETTKFGEPRSGHAMLVQLTAPGAPPRLTAVPTGTLRWIDMKATLAGIDDVAAARRAADAVPDPARALLRVAAEGTLDPDAAEAWTTFREAAESRFLMARFDDDALAPVPGGGDPAADAGARAAWLAALPPGAPRDVAAKLMDAAAAARTAEDATAADTANAALRLLLTLARRAGAGAGAGTGAGVPA